MPGGADPGDDGRRSRGVLRELATWVAARWRQWLGAPLWIAALAAAAAVGWFDPDGEQELFLAACIAAWLLVASLIRLTPNAGRVAASLRARLARHAWAWALAAIGAGLAALVFSGVIVSAGPEGSAAGLAFLIALAAVWAAVVLRVARLAAGLARVLPAAGVVRYLPAVAVAVVALGPIVTVPILVAVGDEPLWVSLAIALGPPLAAVLVLAASYVVVVARSGDERRAAGVAASGRQAIEFVFGTNRAGPPAAAETSPLPAISGGLGLAATALTILSGVLVLAAAAYVPFERQSEERSQVAASGRDLEGIPDGDQALAEFYSPVLRLATDEQWVATDAARYARLAWRARPDPTAAGRGCLTPPEFDAGRAGTAETPCLELDGPSEGFSYQAVATRHDQDGPRPVFRAGVVYPRIVPVADDVERCAAGEVCRIVDYWIFYPNNVWTSASSIGDITQSHGGDWEHVAVGLDGGDQALFVAYSAHCTGYVRPWRHAATVATSADGRAILAGDAAGRPRSHPLVVVARGSHANYPTTGRRDPDWAGCAPSLDAIAAAVRQVTLQAGAVETTPEFGPIQIPGVALLDQAERILTTPWWWGPDERYDLGGLGGGEDDSHGPASPALQQPGYDRLWDSIRRSWDCDLGDPRPCRALGLSPG